MKAAKPAWQRIQALAEAILATHPKQQEAITLLLSELLLILEAQPEMDIPKASKQAVKHTLIAAMVDLHWMFPPEVVKFLKTQFGYRSVLKALPMGWRIERCLLPSSSGLQYKIWCPELASFTQAVITQALWESLQTPGMHEVLLSLANPDMSPRLTKATKQTIHQTPRPAPDEVSPS